jgi:hypothetical protein
VTAPAFPPSPDERNPVQRIPDGTQNGEQRGPEWFYETLGKVIGPLTSAQLLRKVRAGEIAANTPVRKDDSQWVMAEEVNGLFEAAKRPLTHYKCPYCGSRVEKPPTVCLECDREITAVYRVREALPDRNATAIPAPPEAETAQNNGTIVHAVINWLKSLVR